MFDSASELVDGLLNNDVKPQEITEKYLERIKESEDKLNAFITLNEDAVDDAKEIEGEDKPLGGMPIAVKDNVETKGIRTTYGSKFFEDNVPDQDAVIVERLKEAGSVVIGKTNLPELGLIAYTDNPLIGVTHNPWDLERTVGGSSGGSAAAVAAGVVPAATGNDGGGSIRIPASFCHLYGLKPSLGRVPCYPKMPLFMDLHSEGFLTRTVEDTALLLDLIKGRDSRDIDSLPNDGEYMEAIEGEVGDMKIAFSPDLGYATVESRVEELVRESAFDLEEVGTVEEVDIQIPNLEMGLMNKVVLETTSFFGEELEDWKEVAYEPYLAFMAMEEELTYRDYIKVPERRWELWKALRPVFENYDFLITPTVAVPPFELGETGVSEIEGESVSALGWMPFTYPFNFTGQPAASIPAGLTDDGLPVGMQIVGKHYADAEVLKISKAYQDLNPWQDKYKSVNI